jgi:thiamine biosynthesis lipoprotein
MNTQKSGLSLLSIAKRHMATDFQFELVLGNDETRKGESVLHEAHALVDSIEHVLSEFLPDSVVARLNRSEPGEWIPTDEIFREVITLSRSLHEWSNGHFNPFAKSTLPCDFSDLEIDERGHRVRRIRHEALLGFGAIGKGYALDRVREVLERAGFSNYRLDSGGSSWVFGGFDLYGKPWEVAWAWDRDADGDLRGQRYRLPGGRPLAIGVSGTLEQGNHFLREGRAIRDSARSAFYCGRSAAEADALSTAIIVGASVEGEKILTTVDDNLRSPSMAYVDLEGRLFYNRSFETSFLREGRI